MKRSTYIKKIWLLLIIGVILMIGFVPSAFAQLKWLRIGSLHTYFSERGSEVEGSGIDEIANSLYWPAAYGTVHSTVRGKAMWLGCTNFYDANANVTYGYKVVGVGPRNVDVSNQVFTDENFKLIGRFDHPMVYVDGAPATINTLYDELDDDPDESIPSDRMIVIKNNTAIGVTVTKKAMAFGQQDHDNYFIYDYVIKNTGIIDRDGTVYEQTLNGFIFFLNFRYALSGESITGSGVGEGWNTCWNTSWGRNVVNEVINTGSNEHTMQYSWYGPHSERKCDDWGCPNETDDGVMAAARYVGVVTLHADKSPSDKNNDLSQPFTTMYLGSDHPTTQAAASNQFDAQSMAMRYGVMSAGHPKKTHAAEVGDGWANEWGTDPGGYSQCLGFGPYDSFMYGDSIHIVVAEGVAGLSREKNREVGGNWLAYFKGTGTPPLVDPKGNTTTDYNAYKREWVQTGVDSILKTFQNAISNYESGYEIPQPPPPPDEFIVASGGDRICLTWADNATTAKNFDGYVIYRSEGNVMVPKTVYTKIFECNAANVVHQYDDTTPARGHDYYYYIQSKDDGSTNNGVPLVSGMFWTLTSVAATLQRPAGHAIDQVRVVPNPYDIRARMYQFGEDFQYDRIAFYELPPECNVKIFSERGDLIWEKEHTSGTGDELWDSMTSSGQIIVSGIYILYVEVPKDIKAEEDICATRNIYDIRTKKLIFEKDQIMFSKGDLMFKRGESVCRKFVVIR